MTPFTDDDLKRLKECKDQSISNMFIGLFNRNTKTTDKFDLDALLARLEAAEDLIRHEQESRDDFKWLKLFTVWRKTKGESEC